MNYDKQKYEKLISGSVLFSLDKDTEITAYKRESYRMIEYLYCYLMAVNEKKYEPYACEIMEVSTRCINNFDLSKGAFLNYFNAAWKQEYSHLVGNQIVEDKLRGIKITEEDKRNIRKYIKLYESKDGKCSQGEVYELISVAMGFPIEKVRLIAELSDIRVNGDTMTDENGEEFSVWDCISDGKSIEDEFLEADSMEDLFIKLETTFESLQDRQKPIVSDMITVRIYSMLSRYKRMTYNFISNEIVEIYEKTGRIPTQRDIAAKYGRDEASISRTVKEFTKRLKSSLREV